MQDIKGFLTTVDFIAKDDGIGPFSKTGEKKNIEHRGVAYPSRKKCKKQNDQTEKETRV